MTSHVSHSTSQTLMRADVVIIGAGISGLVAAYRLKRSGLSVLVLEKSHRAGGVIESLSTRGYLIERGPNSVRGTQEFLELITDLELRDELVIGDPGLPAYTYSHGELRAVPMSPLALVGSNILSTRGKLRLLREPFIARRNEAGDESIASFVRRRLGPEVLDELVSPFISGIYAGDPQKLSVDACFPSLVERERESGSITAGLLRRRSTRDDAPPPERRESLRRYRFCSFHDGLSTLTDRLAARLDGAIRFRVEVDNLSIASVENGADFKIEISSSESSHQISARAVIVATPATAAASIVRAIAPVLARQLARINYNSLVSVPAGVATRESSQLRGFGFLATRAAGLRTLGSIWNSSAFADRAGRGYHLMTSFIGGTTDPGAVSLSDDDLQATLMRDLRKVLKSEVSIEQLPITRYPAAIPQYEMGHGEVVAQVDRELARVPRLEIAGNYLRGVSVGDCIRDATRIAEKIERDLRDANSGQSGAHDD
jgi:oxygen-dependent protoporphyrinogen oxidase